MRVFIFKDASSASKHVSGYFHEWLEKKPNTIFGLPSGGTPKGVYKRLIKAYQNQEISFSKAVAFNLDEYIKLSKDHPQSFASMMDENFFAHVDFKKEARHIPSGVAPDPLAECQRYTSLIKASGGIDLMFLGIGGNGHIGFNEPDDHFKLNTHLTTLDERTQAANARFFDDKNEVPNQAITMGIKEIMNSKMIVLLALGSRKAEIMKRLLTSDRVTPQLPASILHLHQNVHIVMDEAAAQLYQEGESHDRD